MSQSDMHALEAEVLASERRVLRMEAELLRLDATRELAQQRIAAHRAQELRDPEYYRSLARITAATAAIDGRAALARSRLELDREQSAALAGWLGGPSPCAHDLALEQQRWHEYKEEQAELWRQVMADLTEDIQSELLESIGDEYWNWIQQFIFDEDANDYGGASS